LAGLTPLKILLTNISANILILWIDSLLFCTTREREEKLHQVRKPIKKAALDLEQLLVKEEIERP